MTKRVIYPNQEGGVNVLIPTPEALSQYTIEDLARKDVPSGVKYKIIDTADVPEDRTFRNAWEADFTEFDGEGIGHEAWAEEQAAKTPEPEVTPGE